MDVYAVNTVGPFLALQQLKPLLLAAHAESGRASAVLHTSSIAGLEGKGSSLAYIASKGALNSMTIAMARALAPQIRVNALCPGFIATRWFKVRPARARSSPRRRCPRATAMPGTPRARTQVRGRVHAGQTLRPPPLPCAGRDGRGEL